ncbi:hypothetical protein EDD11_003468 [Mortierella claussenii]|nr:hypothetical protein EDD11_003468 [Mortierella claussenii]
MFKDSAKFKSLSVHIDTGAATGPKGMLLVYGHPETFTPLQATVSFETSHDFKAKGVEIIFKAAAGTLFYGKPPEEVTLKLEGEQVFYSKQWDLDMEYSKPGWIAKGSYSRVVSVALDPSYPSSTYHFNGWMKYEFEARLKDAKGFGFTRADIVVTKDIWILNSCIPFMGLVEQPVVTAIAWKDILQFSVTIPGETLQLDQLLPVTIRVQPLAHGTVFEGRDLLVNSVNFYLQESRTIRALYTKNVLQMTERPVSLTVNTGWPQNLTNEGWERTVFLSIPSSPVLSCSMLTRFLDITHTLVSVMELGTNKVRTERIQTSLEVRITSPRTLFMAPPPGYEEAPQPVDELLEALSGELPSYSRYE